ncbi:MAG: hypothetical protein Q4F57_02655 [Weeksellaceae bacterium]|nr:hypothetical protein [Weeksellaceae bacterium]
MQFIWFDEVIAYFDSEKFGSYAGKLILSFGMECTYMECNVMSLVIFDHAIISKDTQSYETKISNQLTSYSISDSLT